MSKTGTWVRIVVAIVVAAFSIFIASKMFSTPESHAKTNQYLDEKKIAVLELAGAATATSVAISALPNDTGTPIADELADLSGYFLLIVSAIVFEKYLFGVAGAASFGYLIPIACALYIIYAISEKEGFRTVSKKLAAFALAIFLIVPASVKISCMIEETYECSANETVATATQDAIEIAENAEESQDTDDADNAKWWKNVADTLSETADKLKSAVTETASSIKDKLNTVLSKFIDAVAILIVTSCVIPIAVLFALIWVIKLIFGLDWDINGSVSSFAAKQKEKREKVNE